MKLLTKNTIVVLCVTLVVFMAGGFLFYFQLRDILDEEADEALIVRKNNLLEHIKDYGRLPEPVSSEFEFNVTDKPKDLVFSETSIIIINEDGENERVPFRQLFFKASLNGQTFQGIVRKSLIESDDLTETIIQSLLVITVILLILLLTVNFLFSRRTWKPFFKTLKAISVYKPGTQQLIKAEKTNTTEFNQLNAAIETMTEKITSDFKNLKSFTENAAHELQTPLAIISSKTELLLQDEKLGEEQTRQLMAIRQTTGRLSKLTQTLLLLTKIENNQFPVSEPVDFSAAFNERLTELKELMDMKLFSVTVAVLPAVKIKLHPALTDVLISNLLLNAIKYTQPGGTINIELTAHTFTVKNTGEQDFENPANIFDRFYKEHTGSDSTGLGLALVKQIAVINGHAVVYRFAGNQHIFEYSF